MSLRSVVPTRVVLRAVALLLLGCVGSVAAQPPRLGPRATAYFDAAKRFSVSNSVNGTFSGTLANPNVPSSSGESFHFGFVYHLCVPAVIVSGCVYEHDYGNTFNWDFNAGGPAEYSYQFPYTVTFYFPNAVYPGQRVALQPVFSWGNATVNATQEVAYSATTSAWLDAPFDMLDETSIVFTQRPSSADLHLRFPALPVVSSVPLDLENITVPPFNAGGGDFGGSYTKLGGTGSLANAGGITYNIQESEISVGATATSIPAWKQGHELFKLVATVLQYIPTPATVAAGLALDAARVAGDFRLDAYLQGSVSRQDMVSLMISDLVSYVDVPDSLRPGNEWEFTNLPVTVKYRVRTASLFWYPLGYRVTFDMRGIDPDTLADQDPYSFSANGLGWSDWQDTTGTFAISGRVRVVRKQRTATAVRLSREQLLPGTAQARRDTPFAQTPRGIRLAPRALPRVIHDTMTIPFPRPAVRQGLPQAGQQTVILGTTPDSTAVRIVEILRTYGIEAFPVTVPDSPDKAITLGSFANAGDATLLSNMLKEIFQVESAVTPRMDRQYYRTIGHDVLSKLQSRSR